jgi:hypothetical protein
MEDVNPADSLRLIKEAVAAGMAGNDDLQKTFVQSNSQLTGLTAFSLEAPAKTYVPIVTPFRNKLPRVTGGVGIRANWRAVVGYNSSGARAVVSEGNRGQIQSVAVKEYFADFRTIGIDSYVTEEARLAAQGFDDVLARAVQANLGALMIQEERFLLGGHGTYALPQPAAPVLVAKTTGGTLPTTTTYHVRVCALTLDGYMTGSATMETQGLITRQTANGVTDTFGGGFSRASNAASAATTSATASIEMSVTPVPGAIGYAWYVGSTNAGDNMYLQAITPIASWVLTAPPVTSPAARQLGLDLVSNDRSANQLVFDGFIAQVAASGSGALWRNMANNASNPAKGTPLTSDGAGGIVEIDEVLEWYWNNHRLSPTCIWASGNVVNSFRKLGLLGTSSSTQRFTFNTDQRNILMSGKVRGYTNPFGMSGAGEEVPIRQHPNLPPGMIFFETDSLPYSMPGVTDVARVLCRRDYYQLNYPQTRRTFEYGVYADELLQVYFPPANAVLANIGVA